MITGHAGREKEGGEGRTEDISQERVPVAKEEAEGDFLGRYVAIGLVSCTFRLKYRLLGLE